MAGNQSRKKRLYVCKVSLTYYAYTETEDAARDFAEEAVHNAYTDQVVEVREFQPRNPDKPFESLANGWLPDDYAYTAPCSAEEEFSIAEAYAASRES